MNPRTIKDARRSEFCNICPLSSKSPPQDEWTITRSQQCNVTGTPPSPDQSLQRLSCPRITYFERIGSDDRCRHRPLSSGHHHTPDNPPFRTWRWAARNWQVSYSQEHPDSCGRSGNCMDGLLALSVSTVLFIDPGSGTEVFRYASQSNWYIRHIMKELPFFVGWVCDNIQCSNWSKVTDQMQYVCEHGAWDNYHQ